MSVVSFVVVVRPGFYFSSIDIQLFKSSAIMKQLFSVIAFGFKCDFDINIATRMNIRLVKNFCEDFIQVMQARMVGMPHKNNIR
jgi:hypothetical protein